MRAKFTLPTWARQGILWFPMTIALILTIPTSATAQISTKDLSVDELKGTLALYHTIRLHIPNLEQWLKQSENDPTKQPDPSKFVLYIDGNAFKGLPVSVVENNTWLQFDLKRTASNKDAWTSILSRRRANLFFRDSPVTVGYDTGSQLPSKVTASLIVINEFWFYVFVFSFVLSIVLFWWLAQRSDILRVPGSQPEGKDKAGKPNRKPYSLARTQMAFWFFVVIISYVFIWMVTSDLSSLTTSVLGLIGISAATGLGAAAVDSSKQSGLENQRSTLEEQKKSAEVDMAKLTEEIQALALAIGATPPPPNLDEQKVTLVAKQAEKAGKQKQIDQAAQEIAKLSAAAEPTASKRFLDDILSDDGGISFHRFQIFAWTIVLILVFVASVYNSLTMPDFDGTLLALMGISGGTFIGFKLPAKEG